MELHVIFYLLLRQAFFPVPVYALPAKADGTNSQNDGSRTLVPEKRDDTLEYTGVIRINQCDEDIRVTPHETERQPDGPGWQLFYNDYSTPSQLEHWGAIPMKVGESVFILYNTMFREELDSQNITVFYCPTDEQIDSVERDLGQLPSDQDELDALFDESAEKRDLSRSDVSGLSHIEKRWFMLPALVAWIPAFVEVLAIQLYIASAIPFVVAGLGGAAVIGGITAGAVIGAKKAHEHDHDGENDDKHEGDDDGEKENDSDGGDDDGDD